MTFAAKLRALRESRGWTQQALADRAGLTQAALSYLEGGRSEPTFASVHALALALGVSTEAFRDGPLPEVRTVAEVLRSLRESRGLSIMALAGIVGCHDAMLWQIENAGREPRWELLQRIATALGVSTEVFRPQ